jgi:hypothetical protein
MESIKLKAKELTSYSKDQHCLIFLKDVEAHRFEMVLEPIPKIL